MAYGNGDYSGDRGKRVFYASLAVRAHHSFDFKNNFHFFYLLLSFFIEFSPFVRLEKIKAKRVTYDANAGYAHSGGSQHRRKRYSERGKRTRCHGNPYDVIHKRPHQIFANVGKRFSSKFKCRKNSAEFG